MQLDDKQPGDFVNFNQFSGFHTRAWVLVDYIQKGSESGSSLFDKALQRGVNFYPLLNERFRSMNAPLHQLSVDQRRDLKQVLLGEMRGIRAKMDEEINCPKTAIGEELGSDPDACLAKIEELRKREMDKIEQIKKNLDVLVKARSSLQTIRENKRLLAESVYTEDPFTSEPAAAAPTKKKRGQ